ncbi:MAG: 4Fe-4S dicluster domain-containing protein [Ruthenibacterium lactatiformans]
MALRERYGRQRLGVGITVMKAFRGDLLTADSRRRCAHGGAVHPLCAHAPAVASVMSGVHTSAELAASLAYETAPDRARDYAAALATFPKISWRGHCMYCGHCAPCPKGIDVASVTKFLNLARAQGMVPETVREHYAALARKAGECIACGACSKRCPFGVDAVENMRRAEETFGA